MLELALDIHPTPTGASSISLEYREEEAARNLYLELHRARLLMRSLFETSTGSGFVASYEAALELPEIRYLDKSEQAIFNSALLEQARVVRRLKRQNIP